MWVFMFNLLKNDTRPKFLKKFCQIHWDLFGNFLWFILCLLKTVFLNPFFLTSGMGTTDLKSHQALVEPEVVEAEPEIGKEHY